MEAAPIAFVPVDGREQSEGNSHANPAEAEEVRRLVASLLAAGDVQELDIGVVSPYAAQVRLLRRLLGGVRPGAARAGPCGPRSAVEVSSVDGFQGREKEVIIVSTVRANASGGLGFVRDQRRTNVTLTRARRGLIVLGHPATLSADKETWGPWIQWCLDCGLWLGRAAQSAEARAALARGDDAAAAERITNKNLSLSLSIYIYIYI